MNLTLDKKTLANSGKSDLEIQAKMMIGEFTDKQGSYALLRKAKYLIDTMADELSKDLQIAFTAYGVKVNITAGGPMLNYEQDMIYSELKARLAERKHQLDMVAKNDSLEHIDKISGEIIPKVKLKGYRKDAITAKF